MAEVLRRAGGVVTLTEWRDCPHVWQMVAGYLPEAREALLEVEAFVAGVVSSSAPPTVGS
jgi:acetyl esterase/lipase